MIDLKFHDPGGVAAPPPEHITLMAGQDGTPIVMQPDGTSKPLSTNGVLPTVATPADMPGQVVEAKLFFSTLGTDLYLMVGTQKFIISMFPAQ